MAAGDREAAIRAYRLAHWSQPQDYGIAHDLASLLGAQPDPPHAEITRLYSVAAAVRPNSAHALVDLATALGEQGQAEPARMVAERAVALDAGYCRAWLALAAIRSHIGDQAGSVTAARESVRLRSTATSQLVLAHALAKAGDAKGALAAGQQAVQLAPRLPAAYGAVASSQIELGDFGAAIATQRQALTFAEHDAQTWYDLGLALQRAGIAGEAEAAYRRAIELSPDLAEAHCNLGSVLSERGAFDEALAATRRGAELGSRRPGWPYPIEDWIARIESLQAMVPLLDEIAAGSALPDDRDAAVGLARLALMRGDAALAQAMFATIYTRDRTRGAEYLDYVRASARVAASDGAGGLAASPPQRIDAAATALGLLRAVHHALAERLQHDQSARAAIEVRAMLSTWLLMTDLEALRDPVRRAFLPVGDQQAWAKLWEDVRSLYAAQEGR